jgi:hypothetical protein
MRSRRWWLLFLILLVDTVSASKQDGGAERETPGEVELSGGGEGWCAVVEDDAFTLCRRAAGSHCCYGPFELPGEVECRCGGISPGENRLHLIYCRPDIQEYEGVVVYDVAEAGGPLLESLLEGWVLEWRYRGDVLWLTVKDLVGVERLYRLDPAEEGEGIWYLASRDADWERFIVWEPVEQDPALTKGWDGVDAWWIGGYQVAGAPDGLPRYRLLEADIRSPTPFIEITASSTLTGDPVDFSPANLLDCDNATAWCEGVAGPGIGESVTLKFTGGFEIMALELYVGYPASPELYRANGRPASILVEGDDGYSAVFELEGDRVHHYLSLTEPGEEGGRSISELRLTILEVRPGELYDDTCLAEIVPCFADAVSD